jgi:hypothetical protein
MSIGLAMSLVDRWYSRHDVLTRWPLVDTTIQSCAIHETIRFSGTAEGLSLRIISQVDDVD